MKKPSLSKKSESIYQILFNQYGHIETFLTHRSTFELLVAVILSAQCTDTRVNQTTPALFEKFHTPEGFAAAPLDEIRHAIRSINFYNAKARNIQTMSRILLEKFNGQVPDKLEDLITLPGVGRKTANVVLGQAFGQPGITVDTHVKRVSYRLGFTAHQDPVKIERDLMAVWPRKLWTDLSSLLIVHGRRICIARRPKCAECVIAHLCPKLGLLNKGRLQNTKKHFRDH